METNDEYRKKLTLELAKKIQQENNNINSLINAVENYKLRNPQKYVSAQLMGEHVMNCDYELEEGVDKQGELFTINLLKQLIDNGITDFNEDEQKLLKKYNINF